MRIVAFALLMPLMLTIKVFLIGGGPNENVTAIWNEIANSVPGRIPLPNNKCGTNWATTTCPRIAVVTSASADEATGNSTYLVDDSSGLSY